MDHDEFWRTNNGKMSKSWNDECHYIAYKYSSILSMVLVTLEKSTTSRPLLDFHSVQWMNFVCRYKKYPFITFAKFCLISTFDVYGSSMTIRELYVKSILNSWRLFHTKFRFSLRRPTTTFKRLALSERSFFQVVDIALMFHQSVNYYYDEA